MIDAALLLAFVGAVEQNILGFSSTLAQRIAQGYQVLVPTALGDHLEGGLPPRMEELSDNQV